VRWEYGHTPDEGTPEAELMTDFLCPRDWLGLDNGTTVT
jgi:coproporphyrinogen III oxidase